MCYSILSTLKNKIDSTSIHQTVGAAVKNVAQYCYAVRYLIGSPLSRRGIPH